MTEFGQLFGIAAGAILVIAYIPQLRRLYILKRAEEISLGLFIMVGCGIMMYVSYGLYIHDWIITLTNGSILSVDVTLISMKLYYDRRNKRK